MHKMLFYNKFIILFSMFRTLLCPSSGGQNCIVQHLVSSHSVGGRPVRRLGEDCSPLPQPPTNPLTTCAPEGHLQSVMVPDAVKYNFDLLVMDIIMFETCRRI